MMGSFDIEKERVKISCRPDEDGDSGAFVCEVYEDGRYVGKYKFLIGEDVFEFEAENPTEVRRVLKKIGLGEDDLKKYLR